MARTSTRSALAAAALAVLLAPLTPLLPPAGALAPELVVCSARHDGQEAAFEAFTRESGVAVRVLQAATVKLADRAGCR
jgi:hypothetical protein